MVLFLFVLGIKLIVPSLTFPLTIDIPYLSFLIVLKFKQKEDNGWLKELKQRKTVDIYVFLKCSKVVIIRLYYRAVLNSLNNNSVKLCNLKNRIDGFNNQQFSLNFRLYNLYLQVSLFLFWIFICSVPIMTSKTNRSPKLYKGHCQDHDCMHFQVVQDHLFYNKFAFHQG